MHLHKHTVFLGSSSEAKWLAREVEGALQSSKSIVVDAWYHFGSWPGGSATLETLETRLHGADFAILVLAEDDLTQSRDAAPVPSPRDNVLFELGLFMGRLGRDRAFFLFPSTRNFKLPSDLFGITAFPYAIDDRKNAQRVVSPICTAIEKQIEEVVLQQRVKGMQARPRVVLHARFPKEDGKTEGQSNHLSATTNSILKVRTSVDDDEVTDLRVYFDPHLNLRKSTWTYGEDAGGRYFWASESQLEEMKRGGGFVSFDVDRPRRGAHTIRVVALIDEAPRYRKTFSIEVN
jgi:hypothetical protein